jgi:nucleoside transporter
MTSAARNKLSVMMFLEFFIWGTWLPLIFGYLSDLEFSDTEQTWVLNAFTLASFTAMFFSTQFADRNFSAERFMAVSHLIGGLAILGLAWATTFWPFFLLLLLHSLFFVPTISIANSIAFASLKDAQRDFGLVRLWGTIGWIVASTPFIFLLIDWSKVPAFGSVPFFEWLGDALGSGKTGSARMEGVSYAFIVSGIASIVLAGFSLFLPHTPPRPAAASGDRFAWLEAMKLLRHGFVLVLFVVTFIDSAVLQCHFALTETFLRHINIPSNWTAQVMTIGQVAEIATMAYLGYCLKKLGWRMTMVLGILGHTLRFGVYALLATPWLAENLPWVIQHAGWWAVAVNLVHGVCYAFFFATVYIFVDEFFPKDARSSAQGLFNFLILGLGPFVGNFVWTYLYKVTFRIGEQVNYERLFLVPAATAVAAALLLLLFFWPPRRIEPVPEEVPIAVEGAEQFQARP